MSSSSFSLEYKMNTINPENILDIDPKTISFLTLIDGTILMVDKNAPMIHKQNINNLFLIIKEHNFTIPNNKNQSKISKNNIIYKNINFTLNNNNNKQNKTNEINKINEVNKTNEANEVNVTNICKNDKENKPINNNEIINISFNNESKNNIEYNDFNDSNSTLYNIFNAFSKDKKNKRNMK